MILRVGTKSRICHLKTWLLFRKHNLSTNTDLRSIWTCVLSAVQRDTVSYSKNADVVLVAGST